MVISFEELEQLREGDRVSLELRKLWEEEFENQGVDELAEGAEEVTLPLGDDGDIRLSTSSYWGPDNPYISLITDAGNVACDGEICEVIEVDCDAEVIVMQTEDYGTEFSLSFVHAVQCVLPI